MTSTPTPGHVFAQRYTIQRLLGSGGHAEVYLATQLGIERPVALKILQPQLFDGPADKAQVMLKRFEQEAMLISKLRDPHTIIMYDYGQDQAGRHFMAFEYIDGLSLDQLITQQGRFEPKRIVRILRQLLMSLQEAHALGVIHRDIKPQNIMVYDHIGRPDCVKLLDFGIAKLADEQAQNDWTAKGSIVGTPRYTAPERIRSQPLSPASDLYSLGLICLEMATGLRPFEHLGPIEILRSQIADPSLSLPRELTLPGALRQIIDRLMEKDQSGRYQSAEQVLLDLEAWNAPAIPSSPQDAPAHLQDPHAPDPQQLKNTFKYAPAPPPAHQHLLEEPQVGAPTLKLDPIAAEAFALDDRATKPINHLSDEQLDQLTTNKLPKLPKLSEPEPAPIEPPQERASNKLNHRQITPSILGQQAAVAAAVASPAPLQSPTPAPKASQARPDAKDIHTQTLSFDERTSPPAKSSMLPALMITLVLLAIIAMLALYLLKG